MSLVSKSTTLQNYNMFVYRTALHPEFFQIEGRQRISSDEYELEAWVTRGGHAIRFENNGICMSEVVTDRIERMPEKGLLTSLPCAGEKDHETEFSDRIEHITSMQTETLTDHLYMGTYEEMLDHAHDSDGLLSTWLDDRGRVNLSLIDCQRYACEVHVQCYHLRSDCSLVLRTQSIFQLKDPDEESEQETEE